MAILNPMPNSEKEHPGFKGAGRATRSSTLFIDRRTVEDPTMFAGRSDEVSEIISLIRSKNPLNCNIIAAERMGTTSILNFIQSSISDTNYLFVNIDLDIINFNVSSVSEEDVKNFFFQFVFDRLHKIVEKWLRKKGDEEFFKKLSEDYDKNHQSNSNNLTLVLIDYLSDFCKAFKDMVIVLIFDKADHMLEYVDIGKKLRSILASSRNLVYIVVSTHSASEIKSESGFTSPFSTVLIPICFGLMKDGDILEMLQKIIARDNGRPLTKNEQAFILEYSGGHPDFAKVIAHHIYERPDWEEQKKLIIDLIYADLKPICENYWLSQQTKEQDEQFSETQKILLAAVKGDDVTDRYRVNQLQEIGFLTSGRDVQIFSPIFKKYLKEQAGALESAPVGMVNQPDTRQKVAFEIDRVIFENEVLPLSVRELQIFKYLYENRDRPCSQKELYENFWKDQNPFSDEKKPLVNITIQRIRQKINENIAKERITIIPHRGEGFQLAIRMPS